MLNLHAQVLRQLLTQHGQVVCGQPARLRTLLRDALAKSPGNHEQAINVLVLAAQNQVVAELANAKSPQALKSLAGRFQAAFSLTEVVANWAVNTWAAALTPGAPAKAPVAPRQQAITATPKPPAVAASPPPRAAMSSYLHKARQAIQPAAAKLQPGLARVSPLISRIPRPVLLGLGGLGVALMLFVLVKLVGGPGSAEANSADASPSGASPAASGNENAVKPAVNPKLFTSIQEAVRQNRQKNTAQGFGGFGQIPFQDMPSEGAVLIGFEVGYSQFVDLKIIGHLRPIYLTAQGEKMGNGFGPRNGPITTVKAKPGYVVGGIRFEGLGNLDGFALNFMKLEDRGVLNPSDTYQSEWFGSRGQGRGEQVGGDGSLVIGVTGRHDEQGTPSNVGLVMVQIPLLD